ncbi:hypothetical protein ACLOJK_000741 [Asimina triloba]
MAEKRLEMMGPVTRKEWVMVSTMLLAVSLWVFGEALGIASVDAAMIGLSILLLLGVLDWDDCLSEKSAWDTLAWFAVLVGMAGQLTNLCIVAWMSNSVAKSLQAFSLSWPAAFCVLSALFNGYHSPAFPGRIYLKLPKNMSSSELLMIKSSEPVCESSRSEIVLGSSLTDDGSDRDKKNHGMPPSLEEGCRAIYNQFRSFTYAELKKATHKFKEELGSGGSGSVYKGVLDDDRVVAVKKLGDAVQGGEEFWAEVSIIGKIYHMNLVRLWGFCPERVHKLLVYEYVENGSLDKHLFCDGSNTGSTAVLGWKARFKIAVGTAKGLAYLHHECLEWVIHCDMKPENILLDLDFEPKIADFGLAKLSQRTGSGYNFSHMRGTKGYMAPEWASNEPITAKADVYSYGVVLLEVVKGIRLSNWVTDEEEEEVGLKSFVKRAKEKMERAEDSWVGEFVDSRLKGQLNWKQAARMVELGVSCVEDQSSRRPTMEMVVQTLLDCLEEFVGEPSQQEPLSVALIFHPTDEELILHYLRNRSNSAPCPVSIIAEVDIYKFDPWDLPGKAAFGDKEWYFFSPRDRKYPNGARPNRAAASGYWKATGTDKPIVKTRGERENIGVKKALVFYRGKPPKGIKTNWIMHEYRLAEVFPTNYRPTIKFKDSSSSSSSSMSMRLDDWVLCRIYKKSSPSPPNTSTAAAADQEQEQPTVCFPVVPNRGQRSSLELPKTSSFSDILTATDFSSLSHLLADNPSLDLGPAVTHTNQNLPVALDNSGSNSYTPFLPQDNHLKRHQPMSPAADPAEIGAHPSKKFDSSCNLTDTSSNLDAPQYNFLNQGFLNQHILLNSRFGFQ